MDDKFLKELYGKIGSSDSVKSSEFAQPDPTYDNTVRNIYKQAYRHRDRLIDFYVKYTSCFTIIILTLLMAQAIVRMMTSEKDFEIMPQWTLDILVGGMFVQFLGLLKIVTENAWNFKSFFDHHNEMKNYQQGQGSDKKAL